MPNCRLCSVCSGALHEYLVFERLATTHPQPSMVATSTDSDKFLYPILNYGQQERCKGIKAMIACPMSADYQSTPPLKSRIAIHYMCSFTVEVFNFVIASTHRPQFKNQSGNGAEKFGLSHKKWVKINGQRWVSLNGH